MSFRQIVNKSPAFIALAVVVLVGVAGWVVWKQTTDQGVRPAKAGYFSTDEGKTWFVDDLEKIPPFDRDGKQAVRAYIFKCGSGDPVCGYVERYTDKAKDLMGKVKAETAQSPGRMPPSAGALAALGQSGREVKKPGDASWVNMASGGLAISRFACKGGEDPEPINP